MSTILNESQIENQITALTNQIAPTITENTIFLGIDLKGKMYL